MSILVARSRSPLSPRAALLPTLTLSWLREVDVAPHVRAEPCLRPRRVAGTVPSAPAIGRSRLEASRERVVAGYRPVRHWDLPASRHTELLAQDVRMCLRRSRGNAKALADLVVRAPGGDELDDLALPLGDRGERVPQCVVHRSKLNGQAPGDHWPKGVFAGATPSARGVPRGESSLRAHVGSRVSARLRRGLRCGAATRARLADESASSPARRLRS